MATLCGATKGNPEGQKLVAKVKFHLKRLEDKRTKKIPHDCERQGHGCTHWANVSPYDSKVDWNKGMYVILGSFHKLRFHFLSFFDHVLSLHFYCKGGFSSERAAQGDRLDVTPK